MSKTLFISLGISPPAWYRCGLPSIYLGDGYDWAGYAGDPDYGVTVGGRQNNESTDFPDIEPYDVIIVQQVLGDVWNKYIKQWQSQGKKVIYEIDDFVHGIYKMKSHTNKKKFGKKKVKEYSKTMSICDAVIVSTGTLAEYYKKYNDQIYVCKNAIDTGRYDIELPERDWVTIGWAGGTGHDLAIDPWLGAISRIMSAYPVGFCSIGTRYADLMEKIHPGRCLTIPWVSLENLPYALTNIDIVIAPAHESKYHLAKSDLRWLEAGAVGLPVIADERIYTEVEDGVTGITVNADKEDILTRVEDELAVLIYDKDERKQLGDGAKSYIQDKRDIRKAALQWQQVISSVVK